MMIMMMMLPFALVEVGLAQPLLFVRPISASDGPLYIDKLAALSCCVQEDRDPGVS